MAKELSVRQQNGGALQSYVSLRDMMDRLFEDAFIRPTSFLSRNTMEMFNSFALDLYETADDIIVRAALPGIKPENLNVEWTDGRLVIDANIPAENVENVTYHYRELTGGQYHREIALPVAIDANKVDAQLENGLLTLRLPKAEESKPKKINIKAVGK